MLFRIGLQVSPQILGKRVLGADVGFQDAAEPRLLQPAWYRKAVRASAKNSSAEPNHEDPAASLWHPRARVDELPRQLVTKSVDGGPYYLERSPVIVKFEVPNVLEYEGGWLRGRDDALDFEEQIARITVAEAVFPTQRIPLADAGQAEWLAGEARGEHIEWRDRCWIQGSNIVPVDWVEVGGVRALGVPIDLDRKDTSPTGPLQAQPHSTHASE
jgi:hypothetical protein